MSEKFILNSSKRSTVHVMKDSHPDKEKELAYIVRGAIVYK